MHGGYDSDFSFVASFPFRYGTRCPSVAHLKQCTQQQATRSAREPVPVTERSAIRDEEPDDGAYTRHACCWKDVTPPGSVHLDDWAHPPQALRGARFMRCAQFLDDSLTNLRGGNIVEAPGLPLELPEGSLSEPLVSLRGPHQETELDLLVFHASPMRSRSDAGYCSM